LRVHDAERIDHLRDVEPQHAPRRDGRGEVAEERRINPAALDDADARRDAEAADRFKTRSDTGYEITTSRAGTQLGRLN